MALLGALATLVALGIAVPADEIRVRNNINRNVARMEAEGRFRPTSYHVESELSSKIDQNWYSGNKDMYPPELVPFFEENFAALMAYQKGMMWEALIEMGYQPMGVGTFNVFAFQPYRLYEEKFKSAEDAWIRKNNPQEAARRDEMSAEIKRKQEEYASKQREINGRRNILVCIATIVSGIMTATSYMSDWPVTGLFAGILLASIGLLLIINSN